MSIDFITKLPKSKDPVTGITYNLIIVIVDRFTKYLIVVLFKETHTVEQLGHPLLDRLVRDVAVCTVLSYPSIGLGREVEGGLVLAGEECQGARRGLVEHGGGDT